MASSVEQGMTRTERLLATVGLFWLLAAALLGFTAALMGADALPRFALKFHIHAAILGGLLHLWLALFSERTGGMFPVRGMGFVILGFTHGALAAFSAGLLWRFELLAAGPALLACALVLSGGLAWRAFLRNGGFRPGDVPLRPHFGALLTGTGALLIFGAAAWMAVVMWSSGFSFESKTAHTMFGVFGGLLLAAVSVDHYPSPGEDAYVPSWQPAVELLVVLVASTGGGILAIYGQADRLGVPFLLLGLMALLHLVALLPRHSSERYTAWAIAVLFLSAVVLLHRYHATGGDDIRRAAHHAVLLGFVLPLLMGHAFGAGGAPGAAAVLSIRAVTGGAALLVTGFVLRAAGWSGGDALLSLSGAAVVVSMIFGIKVFFESVESEPPADRGA